MGARNKEKVKGGERGDEQAWETQQQTGTFGLFRIMKKWICTALPKMKISPNPTFQTPATEVHSER